MSNMIECYLDTGVMWGVVRNPIGMIEHHELARAVSRQVTDSRSYLVTAEDEVRQQDSILKLTGPEPLHQSAK
jgi:hypothetical protein